MIINRRKMKVIVLLFCIFFAVDFVYAAGELIVTSTEKPKENEDEVSHET